MDLYSSIRSIYSLIQSIYSSIRSIYLSIQSIYSLIQSIYSWNWSILPIESIDTSPPLISAYGIMHHGSYTMLSNIYAKN